MCMSNSTTGQQANSHRHKENLCTENDFFNDDQSTMCHNDNNFVNDPSNSTKTLTPQNTVQQVNTMSEIISPHDAETMETSVNETYVHVTETVLNSVVESEFTNQLKNGNVYKLSKDEQKYEDQIRMTINHSCLLCQKLLFDDQIRKLCKTVCLNNEYIIQKESILCTSCASKVLKNRLPDNCVDNGLQAGHVPNCLVDLGPVERRLISQIQSFMTIIILPGGQYAEKGLAIHFPLDIETYFEQLTEAKSEHFIIVSQLPNSRKVEAVPIEKMADFTKVKRALTWLKINNPLYLNFPDLSIADNSSGISDHNVIETVNDMLTVGPQASVIPLNYTVPNVDIEMLLHNPKKLNIPTQFNQPTWISDVPHGEELAFPWLFPFGRAGILESRTSKLSVLDYFHHRLYHKDPRWRKDITYLMFAVNHMEQVKLASDIEIQMRLKKGGSQQSVTAGNLQQAASSPDVKANSFMFMKNIRGTVAYWADVLSNLLATVKCLGPPSLFVTLSADDCHWPELQSLLKGQEQPLCGSSASLVNHMVKDPLLTSIHFERRWKAFFKYILKGKDKPLGTIVDYFARVEYQNRGSPHLHLFLWTAEAPTIQDTPSSEIAAYIDSIISTTLPCEHEDPEMHKLVKRLQIHHHTSSCRRHGHCRFGFPKSVTPRTKLLSHTDVCNPNNRGKFYETKRSANDLFVNSYNTKLLRRWRANMDIQMVSAAHGLAYYVCNYIAKAEPDDLKNALSQTLQNISSQPQPVSLKKQMYLVGNCVLKTRRLSAQEAAARVGHLQFIWSSRSVIFINTRPQGQRFKLLRPKTERDKLQDDSEDIFCTNIIDYYIDRPEDMKDTSLFKFASWYKHSSSPTVDVSARCQKRIMLKTSGKIMQMRRRPVIIRTPSFQSNSNSYFYSLLMLHLPFCNEATILEPYSSPKEAFIQKYTSFDTSDMHYEAFLHDVERIVRMMRVSNDDIGTIVAPNTHEIPTQSQDLISEDHILFSTENLDINSTPAGFNDETSGSLFHSLQVNLLSPDQLSQNIASLTTDQLQVFSLVQKHFQLQCTSPLRLFVTGGAGTGKSFLIKTLVEHLRSTTAPSIGVDPVLICGPTGMSAKNIRGNTIHSSLRVPVQHGREPQYKPLSSRTLQLMKRRFCSIHTVIIDEISMVSSSMLLFIHRRLTALKENNDYFGVNIILIGDFFQLKPVRGPYAFTNKVLWDLFDTYLLETNMRQKDGDGYSELLNRLRKGHISEDDIRILCSRLIDKDDPSFNGVLRVFPTLKEVKAFNERLEATLDTVKIKCPATHQFSAADIGQDDNIEEFIPEKDQDAGGLPRCLQVSVGTRVMLLRNIATKDGLINGALGFIHHIDFEHNTPIRIYVRFDDPDIGHVLYDQTHDAISIDPSTQEYFCRGRSVFRTQFPLMPAWACSIHKIQGITCDRIVVSLGKSTFAHGQAYVALSRVKSLQGLGIIALDPSRIKADPTVITFYENLSLTRSHHHD